MTRNDSVKRNEQKTDRFMRNLLVGLVFWSVVMWTSGLILGLTWVQARHERNKEQRRLEQMEEKRFEDKQFKDWYRMNGGELPQGKE